MEQRRADRIGNALERGRRLAGTVERVSSGGWVVPSQSAAGELHLVVVVKGTLRCDCKAADAGQPCAHIGAVALHLTGWLPAAAPAAPAVAAAPARARAA